MEQQKTLRQMDFSIVHYFGIQASRCGYCKGTKCSKAYGMHAYTLLPQDYQALINRGWRRSGQYCYKPHNSTTCCPSYTIKCNALEFKLSKSHKKILKRMNRFLRDGKKEKCEVDDEGDGIQKNVDSNCDIYVEPKAPDVPLPHINLDALATKNVEPNAKLSTKLKDNLDKISENSATEVASTSRRGGAQQTFNSPNGSHPCKKSKQMRRERRQAKLIERGITEMPPETSTQRMDKTLAHYIGDVSANDKHKLKIVLVRSRSLKVEKNVHTLYRKYQFSVHNDTPDHVTPTSLERFLYKTPLQLELVFVGGKEFSNTIRTTFALYEKYQIRIHNDPPDDLEDYLTFLKHSPLQYDDSEGSPPEGYGSFHQQYWLDNKLIAVAVLDILPQCLSSVYFFYDPDYSFLSLGTYASLREIEFVQQLSKVTPELKYYYMGFYIHSCPKMRYKGRLVPSELLCPETYTWQLLTDDIRKKLDEKKYQRFNPDIQIKDADEFKPTDLNQVIVLSNNKLCTYGQYTQISDDDDEHDQVLEYGGLVGKECAHRMVYIKA